MALVQWTLVDNTIPDTATFTVNPNASNYPGRKANIQQEQTTAGVPILFQGRDETRKMTISGLVRTQTFYNKLNTWKDVWYPLQLTDDLGHTWDVIILSWNWTRVRRGGTPWRFNYEAEFLVL